jgi:preprotein translocase subunit SecF
VHLLRIVPDNTKFDFIRFRRFSFPMSALLSLVAITLYFTHGLNFGIDFSGGTLIEVQNKAGPVDIAKMRMTVSGLGLGEVQLQEYGSPDTVLIRVAQQAGGEQAQQQVEVKVRAALGDTVDYRRIDVVGPRVSGEFLHLGIVGIMVAIGAILIYLWFRFEWQFALGAMIANVHDIVLTLGFMSITQIDFDLTSIAALLTILGYSLNDTVVIYDRIREMLRRYKKMPMTDLLNTSINSTLSRSVITHVTVSLALLALLLFGGQAIHSFTATMMFGVVLVGTYTSTPRTRRRRRRRPWSSRRRRARRPRWPRESAADGAVATASTPAAARTDRGIWPGRVPVCRHVPPRLDPVPAERHLAERREGGGRHRSRRRVARAGAGRRDRSLPGRDRRGNGAAADRVA